MSKISGPAHQSVGCGTTMLYGAIALFCIFVSILGIIDVLG